MRPRAEQGFTLLELIVVIGIFGVFAAMAYGGLDRVLTARKHIEQSLARTEEYQKAYQRLRADFESAAPRGVRDGDGFTLNLFTYDSYYKRIEFTRGGWANLLNLPRPSLQRVGYFLDDSKIENKKLVRRTWPVLDRAPQTLPIDTPLLERIDALSWRFMDVNHAWSDTWPSTATSTTTTLGGSTSGTSKGGTVAAPLANGSAANKANVPPVAVEMTLRTRDWGDLRLLFRFGPDQLTPASSLPSGVSGLPPPPTDANPGDDSGGSTGGGAGGSSPDNGSTSGAASPGDGDTGSGPKTSS